MAQGLRSGIFLFGYPLGVSDVVTQTARRMTELGFETDIFVDEVSFATCPAPPYFPGVNVCSIRLNPSSTTELFEYAKKWGSLEIFLKQNTSFPRLAIYLAQVLKLAKTRRYRVLIGVEPFGLITAYLLHLVSPGTLLYYNMELFRFSNCSSDDQFKLKQLEIEASGQCAYTLLQDEERGRLFMGENRVPPEKILYLPVSTSGPPITAKSDFFKKIFDLPPNKKIIIYAGHIIDWAMCKEIATAATSWPEDYVLVMNSWRTGNQKESYFEEVVRSSGANTFFNTHPIATELFPEALSSADVGLMFYRPLDENFTEIGSSSNKLAHYLQAGLPVVSSSFPSIERVFDRYGCGLTVSHPKETARALAAIFERYEYFREGALKAFQDHFDFDKAFSAIQDRIRALMGSGCIARSLI